MKKHLPIAIWICAIVFALLATVRANYVADMSAFLPSNPSDNQTVLVEQLTRGSLSRTILIGIEGANPEVLANASRKLSKSMRASALFTTVQNGDPETTRADQAFIFQNRYLLSPTTIDHFSQSGMHEAIASSINLLASPFGLLVKKIFPQDPTGELISVISQLGVANQIQSANDVWVANNGQRALILAQTKAIGTDTDQQEAAVLFTRQKFDEISNSLNATLTLTMAGSPVFSVNSRDAIRSQVLIFSIIGLIAISCLYLWVFRSIKTFMLGALPIISGILAGITAVSFSFSSVHAITIGFGSTLIGEAVDYSIYYFAQAQKQDSDWKQQFWPTIRLGAVASIIGFLALLTTDFPGLAQLSVFTIAGLTSAILVTRYVIPVLQEHPNPSETLLKLGTNILRYNHAGPKLKYVGYIVAALMTLPFMSGSVKWSNQISDLSPISSADRKIDLQLRSDLGAGGTRHLIVTRAPTADSALAVSETVGKVMTPLYEQGLIANFDAPSKLLPSKATQIERKKAIPEPGRLEQMLSEALNGLPVKRSTLRPFLTDAETARQSPILTQASFDETALKEVINSLLYPVGNEWVAIIMLKDSPDKPIDGQLIKKTLDQANLPNAHYVDLLDESNRMYQQYVSGTLTSCLVGVISVFVLLSLALRSLQKSIAVIAPLALSTLVVAGGLGLAGVNLTLLHAVGFLLIVAIGSNYALLIQTNLNRLDPVTVASLVVACLSTTLGFGVLSFTEIPVLKAIGQTVGPGAILSLFFSLVMATDQGNK